MSDFSILGNEVELGNAGRAYRRERDTQLALFSKDSQEQCCPRPHARLPQEWGGGQRGLQVDQVQEVGRAGKHQKTNRRWKGPSMQELYGSGQLAGCSEQGMK